MFPKYKWPKWLIKLTMPEFWPVSIIYLPIFLWVIWKCLRLKNKFYPVIVNPAIDEMGGFFGADKAHINSLFPQEFLPKEIIYKSEQNFNALIDQINNEIKFPCFIKPINSYKGIGVEKIHNSTELQDYINQFPADSIIQECIPTEEEYAVFVGKIPNEKTTILGLTAKQFLKITGDGKSTIAQLLHINFRYQMAKKFVDPKWESKFHIIPEKGETILIQPVGNHNKGTFFYDATDKITVEMETLFNSILPTNGIHYGRFDIKVPSIKNLEDGIGLKIIEFNGTIAEPVSYCDPKYNYFQAQKIIFKHYKFQYLIAKKMIQNGVKTKTIREFFKVIRHAKQVSKQQAFTFSNYVE